MGGSLRWSMGREGSHCRMRALVAAIYHSKITSGGLSQKHGDGGRHRKKQCNRKGAVFSGQYNLRDPKSVFVGPGSRPPLQLPAILQCGEDHLVDTIFEGLQGKATRNHRWALKTRFVPSLFV